MAEDIERYLGEHWNFKEIFFDEKAVVSRLGRLCEELVRTSSTAMRESLVLTLSMFLQMRSSCQLSVERVRFEDSQITARVIGYGDRLYNLLLGDVRDSYRELEGRSVNVYPVN